MSAADDATPVSVAEADALFADLKNFSTLILAISGGPDSTALLVLVARWCAALEHGPKLLAVTVDHGLRRESAREANDVKRLARKLNIAHRTLRWTGRKPSTGLQAAARRARYRLLAKLAREEGAHHVLTAHTRDDQAETMLMRLARGSGLAGLAAMSRIAPLPVFDAAPSPLEGEGWGGGSPKRRIMQKKLPPSRHASRVDLPLKVGGERKNVARAADDRPHLVRPLLGIPKTRLIATLKSARIGFADDPSNQNPAFTRVRIRDLMPTLAEEGLTVPRLALLARRLARANAAIEDIVDAMHEALLRPGHSDQQVFDATFFYHAPEEVALRVLGRAIAKHGDEGPVELGKLEALYDALQADCRDDSSRFRSTLAGALVTREGDRLTVERAPPRRPQKQRFSLLTKRKGGKRKVAGKRSRRR